MTCPWGSGGKVSGISVSVLNGWEWFTSALLANAVAKVATSAMACECGAGGNAVGLSASVAHVANRLNRFIRSIHLELFLQAKDDLFAVKGIIPMPATLQHGPRREISGQAFR
jgi:hypothetical protein